MYVCVCIYIYIERIGKAKANMYNVLESAGWETTNINILNALENENQYVQYIGKRWLRNNENQYIERMGKNENNYVQYKTLDNRFKTR